MNIYLYYIFIILNCSNPLKISIFFTQLILKQFQLGWKDAIFINSVLFPFRLISASKLLGKLIYNLCDSPLLCANYGLVFQKIKRIPFSSSSKNSNSSTIGGKTSASSCSCSSSSSPSPSPSKSVGSIASTGKKIK